MTHTQLERRAPKNSARHHAVAAYACVGDLQGVQESLLGSSQLLTNKPEATGQPLHSGLSKEWCVLSISDMSLHRHP